MSRSDLLARIGTDPHEDYSRLERNLPGRRAIVTGAASGLGWSIAVKLAARGWRLLLIDQDATGMAALDAVLAGQGAANRCRTEVLDVRNFEELRGTAIRFCREAGGIDLVVNSAGVGLGGDAWNVVPGEWQTLFEVNVVAAGVLTAAVLPFMREAGRGHVLNIASAAAYHCLPWIGAYSASKAAVVAMTENLVAELHGTGVQASVMISAFFRSSMASYTLGGPVVQRRIEGLMKMTQMTSEVAARQTLQGVERGDVYIIIGAQARFIYWAKRLLPKLWLRVAPALARGAYRKADALTQSRSRTAG